MADKKISELDQVLQINNDAAIPMTQDSGGTPTTYKAYITQIGAEIGEEQTFSNLQTTSKNLVGAINEVAQGGGGGGSSNANLAPDYDATSTYAVGDWCIYNGTLYQCNTAIPTAEAFDPTHWTAKKVVDELDDKVDTSDFLATNLPIESGSATNTKDYIDSKFKYIVESGVLGALVSGTSGYVQIDTSVPTGYRTTGIWSISKPHPGTSASLIFGMYCPRGLSGNITLYLTYYTASAVSATNSDYQLTLMCEKV